MALSDRLKSVTPSRSNIGCVTCEWLEDLDGEDRAAVDAWLTTTKSLAQLWELCCTDPDKPLSVSYTAFRNHCKHHVGQ